MDAGEKHLGGVSKVNKQGQFWLQANAKVRKSGTHNYLGCKIEVPTHWNVKMLQGYHDQQIVQFIRYGWPLDLSKVVVDDNIPENQKGARRNITKVLEYLQQEIDQGSVVGPFDANPFGTSARFSPLDAIPKKESDDLRYILNLSHPFESGSVNEAVPGQIYMDQEVNLTYPGVDALVRLIRKKGHGSLIFKTDISKYYRQIYMDLGVIHVLGYVVSKKYFFDVVLSMGLKIACYIAQRISNALMYMYKRLSYEGVNYIDDIATTEVARHARKASDTLTWLLNQLNIWEASHKKCEPTTCLTFLGVECDSVEFTLRITQDRLVEILELLNSWLSFTEVSLRQVQSLAGKLNFVCYTVRLGRVFLARIFQFLRKFGGSDKKLRVSEELKKDITWWCKFITQFDGVSMFPESRWLPPDIKLSTDSCLSGCGGWSHGKFFHCEFPTFIVNKNLAINELECLAVIVALKLWGRDYQNCNLLLFCDSQVTVDIINKGKANNEFSQQCLREIVWWSAKCNLWIKMCHLPGVNNRICDLYPADICTQITNSNLSGKLGI